MRQLTPLLANGSIDYTNMLTTSTFGTAVPNALDNSPDTFVGYSSAQNLTHTLDFGPDFTISADSFGLQVRASFPDRIGGVTIYGSNDKDQWTRLTPGLTSVTEDMQTLDVQQDLRALSFRFLKIQMIEPSSNFLELSEFHIFGQRHETVNKLATVTIGSDQALRNRIVPGNTVKLTFKATAPINTVRVSMQGQPATVASSDNLNWTATWVAAGGAAAGTVKFKLDYKTAEGVDANTTVFTTDGSSLYIADQSALIANPPAIAALQDSSGRNQADLLAAVNLLFDSNLTTFTDFRLNGSGAGGYVTFDFKAGGTATLSKVEILARQDSFYTRIKGAVVQGSNDNANWDTISTAAASTMDWQTLTIASPQPYRYIRIVNGNSWYGNMAELRLHGVVASSNKIASTSIASPQSLRNRIVPGNTVKLTFAAKEAINNVSATIQGQAATVSSADNVNFTASATLGQGVATGAVTFAIRYQQQNGADGLPNTGTTDSSSLVLVDEADVIRDVATIATLIDSTANRTAATTLANVNALFDGNLGTLSDFRIGGSNSGVGSYITFDFKAGNLVTLGGVELAARQDSNYARIKGTVIQGSNDNAAWTTLTAPAAATLDWQTLAAASGAYRYLRIYNAGTWYGNMSELRFHGAVTTPPVLRDVGAAVSMTQQGATFNRASGKYVGAVTLTNNGGTALAGPLRLVLGGLTSGVTLDNASGASAGVPYVTLAGPLAAGASANVALTFSNPNRTVVGYTPALLQVLK
nr:discoidin domain-containing protein [Duganella violaceicalia]